MTKQKSTRAGSVGLIALAAFAVVLVAVKHLTGLELPQWARIVILVGVVGVAIAATWSWWRALDEVAQEAHKFAWYWGGSFGMAVAGALLIAVDSQQIADPHIFGSNHSDYMAGAMTVMLAQMIGYLVAWVGWWWSHR